ncbi:cyclase family protein [Fibrella forsythiae]|uniref:Cyclase family protein n=1 Tax=Fibrella forsythiae TaxID=2817061 RepID=A0ABS3JHZ2_9BACT|nr:cyclase family protein [Fibrella forsythiae]MBO0949036.1 cyclase family protein [Fibrella forsythiae]
MQKRVRFDFDVFFTNGGSLTGHDFRLDIAGDTISDTELANCIIADLRLLMVGQVTIRNKVMLTEAHKRTADAHPTGQRTQLIDLSHTIENGLITYKGLPAPIICDFLSREDSRNLYEEGTEFQIGKIEMVTNTGTYLDCPFHRFPDGNDLSQVGLEAFTDLPGTVIRFPHREVRSITADHLRNQEIRNRAILIHTGWDEHWNTDLYYSNHPHLTEDAATYLRDCGAKLVGIDSHNIDDTTGKNRPVHTTLLEANILIVEHLCNLSAISSNDFTFSAAPPKFKGVGTFPVRALAKVRY